MTDAIQAEGTEAQRPLFEGARRVRTAFNLSELDAVYGIKQKAASLIDDIEDLRPQNEMDEVGHAAFFAPIEPHAALPVKEGVRDSLTVWFSERSGQCEACLYRAFVLRVESRCCSCSIAYRSQWVYAVVSENMKP